MTTATVTTNDTEVFGAATSTGYLSYVAIEMKKTRVMFTCKSCKHVWTRDYRKCYREIGNSFYGHQPARPSKNARYEDELVRMENGKEYTVRYDDRKCCPECSGDRVIDDIVKGIQTDHKCDSRCTHAKKPTCDCSCGGLNHGSAYLR